MEVINEKKLNLYPEPVYTECLDKILDQMKYCVCKIYIDDGKKGTGFFCKIPFSNKENLLPVLITNNHIINETFLNNKNNKITLSINNDNEYKEIELKDRMHYTNKEYDITIIELKDEKSTIKKYLELDKNVINNIHTPYIDESIYVLHYPGSKNAAISFGILKSINEKMNYNFSHVCSTQNGSSGAPILNLSNSKIIGIHKGTTNLSSNYNVGLFLNEPIKKFLEINSEKKKMKFQ